jgi:hypothetical protein
MNIISEWLGRLFPHLGNAGGGPLTQRKRNGPKGRGSPHPAPPWPVILKGRAGVEPEYSSI